MENSFSKGKVIQEKFMVGDLIGEGGFSKVYSGINIETKKPLALKLEKHRKGQLIQEGKVLTTLHKKGKLHGIPKLYSYGSSEGINFLAFELLGPNLETLWKSCDRKFSLATILGLAHQMLARLEFLHKEGYIHCDIKPANFAIGRNEKKQIVYLLDYGLCKPYRDLKTGVHKLYRESQPLQGNATFSSINAHMGIEQSRRDDLESLMYVLIYLYKGKFPWEDLSSFDRTSRYAKIVDMKTSIPIELLCKGMPNQFMKCLAYCRGLEYSEKPDYKYIRSLLSEVLKTMEVNNTFEFDWELSLRKDDPISTNFSGNWSQSEPRKKIEKQSSLIEEGSSDIEDEGGISVNNNDSSSSSEFEVVRVFPSKACLIPYACRSPFFTLVKTK